MTDDRYKEGMANLDTMIVLLKEQIALYEKMKVGIEQHMEKKEKENKAQQIEQFKEGVVKMVKQFKERDDV